MRGSRSGRLILNCDRSAGARMDWTFADAVEAGVVADAAARAEVDLRADDWPIRDQGSTGACVGFAAADGVLHSHYRQAGLLAAGGRPSPRFIWMANKETDLLTSFPTTFVESAGTQIKLALRVARKYGCVTERTLPMDGTLSSLSTEAFYAGAAKYRIASYHMRVPAWALAKRCRVRRACPRPLPTPQGNEPLTTRAHGASVLSPKSVHSKS